MKKHHNLPKTQTKSNQRWLYLVVQSYKSAFFNWDWPLWSHNLYKMFICPLPSTGTSAGRSKHFLMINTPHSLNIFTSKNFIVLAPTYPGTFFLAGRGWAVACTALDIPARRRRRLVGRHRTRGLSDLQTCSLRPGCEAALGRPVYPGRIRSTRWLRLKRPQAL